uniref:Immunoglobulin V-set domain-containing protein n=1 Tax=Cyprinodon variegatus TaxID=28743 RepID=A0A3Q2D8H8_CYPVA
LRSLQAWMDWESRAVGQPHYSYSLEGSSVTLSYSYSNKITASDDFFWYQQYPGKPPEFIMHISGLNRPRSADNLKSASRFSTKLREEKHLDLLISSAELTDSAVYYCAVRPTVTGNTRTLYKNLQYCTTSTRGSHTLLTPLISIHSLDC